ncbi:hypothetical protein NE551_17000, partial [Erysipelatoclostridium ramosum]|nr:hypothetical protein [Thomasclavelia ramosa]
IILIILIVEEEEWLSLLKLTIAFISYIKVETICYYESQAETNKTLLRLMFQAMYSQFRRTREEHKTALCI